ncbi:GNAT family N-acetyltransferase [Acinetobacter stercoris]|uniref:N-acyltransferase YncA n=1 Tax=Acinetobacter stercoris TaxID=2126983 RepID=A0A2U3MU10_9GAMM|nr:GNAT family N-acetyltransferase [Acinetobacter stercoris]SPL68940.1 N-acyltransferase YncA [Acinetobacter stercoris]
MSFQIRLAIKDDLKQILDIYNAEISNGTATWNNEALSLERYTRWYEELLKARFPLFVAVEIETQSIAGYADYSSFRSIAGFAQTVEHSVFVHPDFSRQGLGKKLIQTLINHARQNNIHVMVAAIDHDNIASIRLHEKFGFKQTGYMPEVGQKFGKWRDLVLMQLSFSENKPNLES